MENQNDRVLRRKKRKLKKRQQSIAVLTILTMLISAGMVHAQVQGYEIFYQGQSLGSVKSASVFDRALSQIEKEYQLSFENDDLILAKGFELVSSRVDQTLDVDQCFERLAKQDIELYVNGMIILCDNQVMGIAQSSDEANRLKETYQAMYPSADELVFIKEQTALSKSSDFETILSNIQHLKAQ